MFYLNKKEKVVISVMEVKLKEIDDMLKRKIINQDEHEELRRKIISKFI